MCNRFSCNFLDFDLKHDIPGIGYADGNDIKVKKSEKKPKKIKIEEETRAEVRRKYNVKREEQNLCRVKPDIVNDRAKERDLVRIATKGSFSLITGHQLFKYFKV